MSIILSAFGARADAETPVLYGLQTYSSSESSNGIYTLRAEQDAQPEIYWSDGDIIGNGGAIYVEGKYYVLNYLDFFGSLVWSYLVCDLDEQTYEFNMFYDFTPKDAGSALTYDPSTGVVYSICIDEVHPGGFTLSTMDLENGRKTPIVPVERRMLVMASTLDGVLYGVANDGNLYTIDKSTGSTTLVGPTGVSPKEVNQSAVIDYETDVMYWTAMEEDASGLYTVDLATGAATLVSNFTENNQLVGITLRQSTLKASSPAPATNLTLSFDKADLKGKVSFDMPSKDVSGNPISGSLGYIVTCNSKTVTEGRADAGTTASIDAEVADAGNTYFTVVVKSEGGEASSPATISRWIGPDTPAAVTGLTIASEGNDVTLSWGISETGIHGGYVDPETVRYIVIRLPENVVIADAYDKTSLSETLDVNGMVRVSYVVTPYTNKTLGPQTESETVVVGSGLTVPFIEDLTKPGCIDTYTIVDANEDGISWYYSDYYGAAVADYTTVSNVNNDWLFTPRVYLEAGTRYKVTLNLRSAGVRNWTTFEDEDAYAGCIGVSLGTKASVDAMTQTVIADSEVVSARSYDLVSEDFLVDADGYYVLGVSHTGESSHQPLYLYSISMESDGKTGVESVAAGSGISVFAEPGILSIVNPDSHNIIVCTIDGSVVYNGRTSTDLSLSPGLYLVSTPSRTFKVFVR